jgi:hypothetical protein
MFSSNNSGATPSQEDLETWANTYGLSTPVLSDAKGASYRFEVDNYIPTTSLLGPGMEVLIVDGQVTSAAIEEAIASGR